MNRKSLLTALFVLIIVVMVVVLVSELSSPARAWPDPVWIDDARDLWR